jgi:hypothetical protein
VDDCDETVAEGEPVVEEAVIPSQQFFLLSLADPLPLDRLRQAASSASDWQLILPLASHHDVIPQLHQAVQQLGEEVPLPVREELRALYSAEALRSLQLAQERFRMTAMLLEAGIPVIPWKGPALAEQFYGEVTLRSFADLDLLVPPERAWQALKALLANGYSPSFAVPERRWQSLLCAVNHLTLVHTERNWMTELHWALFHPIHVFPFDLSAHWQILFADEKAREGQFGSEETLVLLCAHGTVHRWEKLKWVVDIDRLVRRTPELEWKVALEIADRMGSRRGLLLGLTLARYACGLPLPAPVEALLRADAVVASLADEVRAGWFTPDPSRRNVPREYLFHLRSRERRRDQILWVLRQLFAPRQADWQLFPLGSYCYPLFYLERPVRMVWKWGVRPIFKGVITDH